MLQTIAYIMWFPWSNMWQLFDEMIDYLLFILYEYMNIIFVYE